MNFKLSKLSLAMACVAIPVGLNISVNETFYDEDGAYNLASKPIISGVRWTVNNAYACSSQDNSCGGWDTYTVYYSPPSRNDWDWDYDPYVSYDYYSYDDYDGGGGGGSSQANDGNKSQEPLMDMHSQRDMAIFVSNILTEVMALKTDLLASNYRASDLHKLNSLISGLNLWIGVLNGGAQLSEHLIAANYNAAWAEAGALISGTLVGLGVTAAAGAITAPALAAMMGAVAAYGVATIVERNLNRMEIADFIDEQFNTDIYDSDGNTFSDSFDRFRCVAGVCTHMPPIILDLDGDGLEMIEIENSKTFIDFDNDGYEERVSWVNGDDGILFIDLNDSGSLDDYYEFSISHLAGPNKTDLDGLRTLDRNNDELLDAFDGAYSKVGVWVDKNRNAKVDDDETQSLIEMGIVSITLAKNQENFLVGGSLVLDTLTYDSEDNFGVKETKDAYNVMVLASEDGHKVTKLQNGIRIIEKELSGNSLDMRNIDTDTYFNLGLDEVAGISSFGSIRTGDGNDSITITKSDGVYVSSRGGDDLIIGGKSHDRLNGGAGDDRIFGENGDDTISGGNGKDLLKGGRGNDFLKGGKGNDRLNGGFGNDILKGGGGFDTFIISEGADVIKDFVIGEDKLKIRGAVLSEVEEFIGKAKQIGKDTEIIISSNSKLKLKGVIASDLSTNDFKL
ncbi:hypothetical protein OE749_07325 [Aestuariibacter sp. AA17]|uniref:Uncharacterized protein n=1 Tax=Fluctibacter corallii TaxID=2984329 RepID=A0ABT3A739_9ALTE|nr:calcium-binding protein [Aestuariibacter sp. AA17]MCV2884500.1 hypothetical protein [Aestuariibacter sp. AA17]